LEVIDGTAFFSAPTGEFNGRVDLWKSDGTVAGTMRVRSGFYCNTSWGSDMNFTSAGNKLLFQAPSAIEQNSELWSSDGTGAGTTRLLTREGFFQEAGSELPWVTHCILGRVRRNLGLGYGDRMERETARYWSPT
jgi:ELWxxDGT repeat protein